MPGPLGSDTNSPAPDAGTSALTTFTAPGFVGLSLGRLTPEFDGERAATQFNIHSIDIGKLRLFAKDIAKDLGGQDRILMQFHYLEGNLGARLLRAFYKTAHRVNIEPAFLMAVAFAEGLNRFVDTKMRLDPHAKPDNYKDIGMDRFLKEKYRLGKNLPDDLKYSSVGSNPNEKNEIITRVVFGSVEDAIAALGAMIVDRQAALERDLAAFGIGRASVADDDFLYWTYVYYNAGTGPPSDPKGTGRQHLAESIQAGSGLAVPKMVYQSPGDTSKSMGNAQRAFGILRVFREVGIQ